jgi:hypothetical protein
MGLNNRMQATTGNWEDAEAEARLAALTQKNWIPNPKSISFNDDWLL